MYDEHAIAVLTELEAVRKRPGMYVGSTGPMGIAHLAFDLTSQAMDAGATRLSIDTGGGALTARYDRPHIPREVVDLCVASTWAPLHPTVHMASQRLGFGVVLALSSVLVLTAEDDRRWQRVCVRGAPVGGPADLGPPDGQDVVVHLVPDAQIFGAATLPVPVVAKRLGQLAVLNPELRIALDGVEVPSYGGLLGYAQALAGPPTRDAVHAVREDEVARIEVAVAWGAGAGRDIGFANQLACEGPHLRGLASGLRGTDPTGRVAIVSVTLRELVFEGRTRRVISADAEPTLGRRVRALVKAALQTASRSAT